MVYILFICRLHKMLPIPFLMLLIFPQLLKTLTFLCMTSHVASTALRKGT